MWTCLFSVLHRKHGHIQATRKEEEGVTVLWGLTNPKNNNRMYGQVNYMDQSQRGCPFETKEPDRRVFVSSALSAEGSENVPPETHTEQITCDVSILLEKLQKGSSTQKHPPFPWKHHLRRHTRTVRTGLSLYRQRRQARTNMGLKGTPTLQLCTGVRNEVTVTRRVEWLWICTLLPVCVKQAGSPDVEWWDEEFQLNFWNMFHKQTDKCTDYYKDTSCLLVIPLVTEQ